MKIHIASALALTFATPTVFAHDDHKHDERSWEEPPPGLETIGDSHGEIDVAANGEIYVSVLGGKKSGIQIYSPNGDYLRNIENAPSDFHGFVIHEKNGTEFIYGAGLVSQEIYKLTMEGKVVLKITTDVIPDKFKGPLPKDGKEPQKKTLKLTAVDVADNGDLYVVDGYGIDFIHRFGKEGTYLESFGGRGAPLKLANCHKISIDRRFSPARILACDRQNLRLLHLNLQGELIGEIITGLKRPSAVSFYGDYVAVAEINGAVSILDKEGNLVKELGTPAIVRAKSLKPNQVTPENWVPGRVTTPHGITFDAQGNVFVTEYNIYGRLLKFETPLKGIN